MRSTGDPITSFPDWIAAMESMVETRPGLTDRLVGSQEVMDRILAGRDHLDLAPFTPGTRSYARHLVHRDPQDRFCLLVLVWKPGQGTPIHDHDGTFGVYGVLRNKMRFVNYASVDGGLVPIQRTIATEGSSTTVLPPHCDIHRMENPDRDELSMTLHCYGKEVLEFNIFQPESGARRPGAVTYDTQPHRS